MANPIITVLTVTGIVGSTGAAVAMNTDILNPAPAHVQETQEPIVIHIPAPEAEPVIVTQIIDDGTESQAPNATPKKENKTSSSSSSASDSSTSTQPPATNTHTGGSSVSGGTRDDEEDEYENEDSEEHEDEQEDD